jgi:hypothetical protein
MVRGTPFKNEEGSRPSIVTIDPRVNRVLFATVTVITPVDEEMAIDTTLVFVATVGVAGQAKRALEVLLSIPGVVICHKYPVGS